MDIEKQIEFDKIKEQWKALAVTNRAREQIEETTCCLAEGELRKQLRDTTNSKILLEKLGTPPLQNVAEAGEILTIAEKGDCLTPYQLERVESVLAAVRRLKDYLGRGKQYENPLAYYEENFDAAETLREEISRQIRNGAVDDYASKELRQIRSDIMRCGEQMKQKAEQLMRANRERMADSYCTTRNGRICVPVKKEYKFKIPGSVIDKSATGSTFFIEPASVAKYDEELQQLRISEENEVYRILYTLTAMVAESVPLMRENIRLMEKLDFIFSKGKLSMDMDAVEPAINTGRYIVLKDARHPLMDRALSIPLQFNIGRQARGIIITGPNTGGKTVAIKTVMLSCVMAQCGLHVACGEADICMNSTFAKLLQYRYGNPHALRRVCAGAHLVHNHETVPANLAQYLQHIFDVRGKGGEVLRNILTVTDIT